MEHIATSTSRSASKPTPVTAELRKSNTDTTTDDGSGLTGSLADTNADSAAPVSNTVLRRSERVAKRKQATAERGGQVEEAARSRKRKRDEEEVGDIKGDISMGDVVQPVEKENVEEDIHAGTKTSVRAKRARKTPCKQAIATTDGGEGSGTGTNVVASVKTQTRRKRKNAGSGSKAKGTTKAALVSKETTATRSNVAETNRELLIVDAPRDADRDDIDVQNTAYWYSQFHEPLRVDPAASCARVSHRPVDYSTDTARFHQPMAFPPDDIRSTLAHEDHIERVAIELLLLKHRRLARVSR